MTLFLQSYGQFVAGSIDEKERKDIVRFSCPGAGACGGMYTANTMASAIEAMGMTLPYRWGLTVDSESRLKSDFRFQLQLLAALRESVVESATTLSVFALCFGCNRGPWKLVR